MDRHKILQNVGKSPHKDKTPTVCRGSIKRLGGHPNLSDEECVYFITLAFSVSVTLKKKNHFPKITRKKPTVKIIKTESVKIETLAFDPANARKHDAKNLDAIKGSLARFGQQKPIVVGKNNVVIAGNGTLNAARSLGWKNIDVVKTELIGPEATAFALADNRSSELASWDDDILGKTLQALQEDGFPIADIGFDPGDFWDDKNEGLTDPDDIPEVPQNVRNVERGQIWQLGDHRMMCGSFEDMPESWKPDCVVTDPPYGMSAVEKSGVLKDKYKPVIGDGDANTAIKAFKKFGHLPGAWWGANYYTETPLPNAGKWLVWDKNNGGSDQADCELAWTNSKGVVRKFLQASEKTNRVHPTQKPVSLLEWCLGFVEGEKVADLFLGSGSTLIACEKTGRRCFGLEIDPHYCSSHT